MVGTAGIEPAASRPQPRALPLSYVPLYVHRMDFHEGELERCFPRSREPCGYCGSHDDVRTGLGDFPKCLECRMRSGQEPLMALVVDAVLYRVGTLRALIVVEQEGARALIDGDGGAGDSYAAGRVGGYDLVIDAIDRRFPGMVPDEAVPS